MKSHDNLQLPLLGNKNYKLLSMHFVPGWFTLCTIKMNH